MLDEVLATTIKRDDLTQIVGAFVKKAKDGHIPSATFLLKMLGSEQAPQTIVVNNFESDHNSSMAVPSVPRVESGQERRRSPLEKVTVYLSAAGESTPNAIASSVALDVETVVQILDANPSRFSARGNKYSVDHV
jgi:hypothetical protein